jgi:hypothetical protein
MLMSHLGQQQRSTLEVVRLLRACADIQLNTKSPASCHFQT